MPKQKRLPNDTEAHLGLLGIHPTGYEKYESATVTIEGVKDGDYRMEVDF